MTSMILTRRLFLASCAVSALFVPARAQDAAEEALLAQEPFPVRAADENKIEYKYRRRGVD